MFSVRLLFKKKWALQHRRFFLSNPQQNEAPTANQPEGDYKTEELGDKEPEESCALGLRVSDPLTMANFEVIFPLGKMTFSIGDRFFGGFHVGETVFQGCRWETCCIVFPCQRQPSYFYFFTT